MATILIIDDRPTNREYLVTLLRYAAHRVFEAANGAEALKIVHVEKPDLIITDILMPTMDGYEFVRQLRTDPDFANLPVIFYTATYKDREARSLAKAAKVEHVLTKPADPQAILDMVSAALSHVSAATQPSKTTTKPLLDPVQVISTKLTAKVGELNSLSQRLEALIEHILKMASEREPKRLLEIACDAARAILGARYAAIGMLAEDGQSLKQFVSSGMDSETIARIGPWPKGQGILGKLLEQGEPLRLADISADPASTGFPPGHPPMRSFLGVPLASPTSLYGRFYLTERIGASEFSEEDERLAVALATHIAVAYENAYRYDEIQRYAASLQIEVTERKRAEWMQELERARWQSIVEGIADEVWMCDAEGKMSLLNLAAVTAMGLEIFKDRSVEEVYQEVDIFYPDGQPRPPEQAPLLRSLQGEIVHGEEIMRHRQTGRSRYRQFSSAPTRDASGAITGAVAIVRDITEQKTAEEGLHRYELLSEHSRDIILFMRREDGRILEANAAALQAYGYSRDELLALSILDLRAPETLSLTADQIAQADAGGILFETVHQRKDGSTFPVEVSSRGATIGGVRTLVSIVRDITARIHAEQALLEGEEKYRLLAENSNDWIYWIKPDAGFRYVSPACERVTGFTPLEFMQDPRLFIDIIHPEDRERVESHFGDVREGGETHNLDYRILTKSNEVRWISHSCDPVYAADGRYMGRNGTNRDITERKLVEEQLERSNQKLNEILESIQDDFYVLDRDWNFVYASRLFTSKIGKEPKDFIGNNIWKMFPKHVGTALEENFRAAMEKREARRFEIGGKYTPAWYRMTAFPSSEGITVIGTDITEQKQSEEQRIKLANRLALATRSAHLGIWDWDIQKNNLVWDEQMYALYGLQQGEFGRAYEAWLNGIHPEDRTPSNEVSQQALRGEREYDTEFRIVRPDGSVRWLKADGEVFRDELGRPLRMVGVNYDITERKLMEQALSDSEARYRGLVESQLDLIVRVDPQGCFTFVNDAYCQKFGLKREEILGQETYQPLVHPEDLPHTLEAMKALYQPPYRVTVEQRAFSVEGVRWIEWQDSAIRDEAGRIVEIQAIGRDITERKRAEEELHRTLEELKRSNAELEEFAYVASHDLQEPLRGIAGLVELLQRRYQGQLDSRADEYITHIVDGTQRMQTLINDLLAYSRVGRRGEAIQATETNPVLQAALKNLDATIREYGATVTNENLPTVKADATQLVQVFQNLIGNAIKFRSERPPQIHVGVADAGESWQFCVCDNGIGIEPQYFERIFQVFQRLHTRREYQGTGIGLAICKKIIERHGGRIWVVSETGQGSTFYFTLPKG